MIKNDRVSLYVDTLVINDIVSDPYFNKKAGLGDFFGSSSLLGGSSTGLSNDSEIMSGCVSYFSSKVDPSNPTKSFTNLLAPGAVLVGLSSLGMPVIGTLVGLLMSVFKVDVHGMLKSAYEAVERLISGGKKTTSEQVDSAIQTAASQHVTPATEQEAEAAKKSLTESPGVSAADDGEFDNYVKAKLREARSVKLTIIHYEESLRKNAGLGSFFNIFASRKAASSNIFIRIISLFFKIGLASLGLMVAGDLINKYVGIGGNSSPSPAANETPPTPLQTSTQKTFPVSNNYAPESNNSGSVRWIESYTNNEDGIEKMLLDFANEVYGGLGDKQQEITSSTAFKSLLDDLVSYNRRARGQSIVVIPNYYHSKKQIVDMFIDDVARKTQISA